LFRKKVSVIAVSTIPGQTTLTRMVGANSIASDFVMAITPPFDAT